MQECFNIQIRGSLLAFEFWLYDWESSEYITDFKDSPITLTFVVDKDKVKNWADLVVYYIDENGEKAEAIDVTYNEKTGEVFVTVTHFSTYALFEEEGSGTAKSVNTQSDQGGEEENTGTVKVVDESGTTGSSGSTDKDGQRLPNTATDHFNLLMMGVIVFGLGGSILLVRYLRLKVTNG